MIRKIKSYHLIPLFCLIIYILISLSSLINTGEGINVYTVLVMTVIQISVFMIPGVIYCRIKGIVKMSDLGLNAFRVSNILLTVCAAAFMFCLSVLFGLFAGPDSVASPQETDIQSLSFSSVVYLTVVYCIVPAVTEEFVFRGIIYKEYRKYGILCAVVLSSALFSLMHFSFSDFFKFMIFGMVLAVVYEVTRSLYASMISHFLFNLLTVFSQKILTDTANKSENMIPFIFIFSSFALLFLFFSLSRVQRQFEYDSVTIEQADNEKFPPLQTRIRSLFISLITPSFWACAAYAAVAAVIRLKSSN